MWRDKKLILKACRILYTDKKENKIFLIYKERGIGCKSYMTNGLLIYGEAFPHILGSPSSYMTLHPIPSEFPYIWRKFCFLFYRCTIPYPELSSGAREPLIEYVKPLTSPFPPKQQGRQKTRGKLAFSHCIHIQYTYTLYISMLQADS